MPVIRLILAALGGSKLGLGASAAAAGQKLAPHTSPGSVCASVVRFANRAVELKGVVSLAGAGSVPVPDDSTGE